MKKKIVKSLLISITALILIVIFVISGYSIFINRKISTAKFIQFKDSENIAANASIVNNKSKKVKSIADGKTSTSWKGKNGDYVVIDLGSAKTFNTIVLKESLNCVGSLAYAFEGATKKFSIYAMLDNEYKLIHRNDKIDAYRLCTFDAVTTSKLKFVVDETRSVSKIEEFEIYNVEKVEKTFRVNDYFVYEDMEEAQNREKFKKLADTVTDLTLFIGAGLDLNSGKITFSNDNEMAFATRLSDVKELLNGKNIKLYINLLSYDAKAKDFVGVDKTAKNVAEFLVKYDLDGVDFDWEYASGSKDWKAYNNLVITVKSELKKVDKKISVAIAVWNVKFSKEAQAAIDFFNVMIYDHNSDDFNKYHSTFKQTTLAIERLMFQKYDLSKICLGMPYYGREYSGKKVTHTPYRISGITTKWENVPNKPKTSGNDGKSTVCEGYFNGYAMIRDKVSYAINMNLGGIMSWHMMTDFDLSNPLSLHNAVREAMGTYLK